MSTPDRIERTVTIQAPRAVVWPLVSQPGWWINTAGEEFVDAVRDGRPAHRTEERDGRTVVVDDKLGEFPLVTEACDEPDRVAFRWAPWDLEKIEEGSLVEFTLSGPDAGPTTVTVVESGLAALDPDISQATYDEHEQGWRLEMGALAKAAELGAGRA